MWHNINVLHLTENMCLNRDPEQREFTQWLLEVGCGMTVDANTRSGLLSIPQSMVCANQDDLIHCHCLSKQLNCSHGTCSGLATWQPRCTAGALSRMRHVVLNLTSPLIVIVAAQPIGGVNPMTRVLSMTHAFVPAPVPFPQLSPHVCSYCPIIPSPCTLGQQVIASSPRLIVSLYLMFPSYCLVAPRVLIDQIIASLYAIVLVLLIVSHLIVMPPYLAYICWLLVV